MTAWNSLPSNIVQMKSKSSSNKTNKATPHGTMPLSHVTYSLYVCTDMCVKLIDEHIHTHYTFMFLNVS